MPVTMICPNLGCRRPVVASETARGKIVRCAYCNQPFLVPVKPAAKEPAADPKSKKNAR
ncbi:MAG: hypothetical protein IPM64_03920 [Phycisphaerales bacterium]|nr:hypothetical protein [Phycisphaerales bacterium]